MRELTLALRDGHYVLWSSFSTGKCSLLESFLFPTGMWRLDVYRDGNFITQVNFIRLFS